MPAIASRPVSPIRTRLTISRTRMRVGICKPRRWRTRSTTIPISVAPRVQQLLGIGNSQQEFAQGVIDAPWTMLDRLRSTTPVLNNTGGTTTTEAPDKTGTSLMQGGLGLLGMILSGL